MIRTHASNGRFVAVEAACILDGLRRPSKRKLVSQALVMTSVYIVQVSGRYDIWPKRMK